MDNNNSLKVFMDELDKCRPNFLVEMLEIIKYYFNIPIIVFIFAIYLEQLSYCKGYFEKIYFKHNLKKILITYYPKMMRSNYLRS